MALHTLPELPYDYAAPAPVISPEIIELHHDKHHAAYVKGANDAVEQLKEGGGEPLAQDGVGELAEAIKESFGSFAGFKAQLSKAAATTQGSGWGVLAYEPLGGRLIVEQVYDHQGNVGQGSTPILVFDAWEHAFYLQYKNQKADFIDALWAVVNWQDVARRYAAAEGRGGGPLLEP